ncbi:MAG: ABC transporter permease [Oscillospiraceae bacterium]|jgi:putative ABC transport system permease protein|nr:ABC transporter permease [Oscillospiraceae bacterium]
MGQILLSAVSLGLLWSVLVLGVYVTYKVLDIADLTVEGSIVLGAAVAASMIRGGHNPAAATIAAFFAGSIAGLVTAVLHTKLKIPALLAGILTMTALWSVNLRVMNSANVSILRIPTVFTAFTNLGVSKYAAWIILGGSVSLLLVFALYWFFGTELGGAIRATGINKNMVRAQGINTDTMMIIGLMISNALVALSGALIAQSQSFADVQMGMGSIVIGLASLIVGEVLLGRRFFLVRLLSVIFGAVVYRVIIALVMEFGMVPNDLKLFTAITVTVALSVPYISAAVKQRAGARDGGGHA